MNYDEKCQEIYRNFLLKTFLPILEDDGQKIIKWEQGWYNSPTPINAFTNREYSGINSLLLYLTMKELKTDDPRFCTFDQARNNKCFVKNGEHAAAVIQTLTFPYYDLDKDPDEKNQPLYATYSQLRYMINVQKRNIFDYFTMSPNLSNDERYNFRIKHPGYRPSHKLIYLFHASQIGNIGKYQSNDKEKNNTQIELSSFVDYAAKGMHVEILNDGGNGCYFAGDGNVHLAPKDTFKSEEFYNVVALHELSHATGTKDRLNRPCFEKYALNLDERAKEELIAELSAVLTRKEANIKTNSVIDLNNHLAYLQSWKSVLSNPDDRGKIIDECFKAASKASNFIIYKEREYEKTLVQNQDKAKQVIDKEDTLPEIIIDKEGR